MAAEPALALNGVTKRFGPVTAVSDFSARVEPGVVTGFLGPNGAGKTTSLRILLIGIDGSGKSGVVRHLAAHLRGLGADVLATREPGGTPEGESLRAFAAEREAEDHRRAASGDGTVDRDGPAP